MIQLEYLRVRWRVVIYLAVILAAVVLAQISSGHSHAEVDGQEVHADSIPLAALIMGSGFVASAFGAFLASLNALDDTLPNLWTKPVPRERMAISIIAVDLLAILAVWAGTFALVLVAFAGLGLMSHLFVDPMASGAVWLGLATAFMSYGNVQALTAWHQGKGGMIAGIAAGSYFVLVILGGAPLQGILHNLVMTLNIFNPLAYLGISSHNNEAQALFKFNDDVKVAIMFVIGVAGCAIGVFGWKRMEI
jgi:hypothetical protein